MPRFFLIFYLAFCIIFSPQPSTAQSITEKCSDSQSYIVFKSANGEIIAEDEADEIRYPASLTKLMTLYLTFEAIKEGKISLKQNLVVSDHVEYVSKINKINTLNLKKDDQISVNNSIKASVVKSINETSLMLAQAVSGNEWDFVKLMNQKAKELKMTDTNFRNSYGWHDLGQYTTSRDLYKLTRAIIRDFPEFYHFFSLTKFKYKGQIHQTTNHFLTRYKGADGIKTGFTRDAGFNLIAAAKRKKHRLISILLSCESQEKREQLTEKLLDNGFNAKLTKYSY